MNSTKINQKNKMSSNWIFFSVAQKNATFWTIQNSPIKNKLLRVKEKFKIVFFFCFVQSTEPQNEWHRVYMEKSRSVYRTWTVTSVHRTTGSAVRCSIWQPSSFSFQIKANKSFCCFGQRVCAQIWIDSDILNYKKRGVIFTLKTTERKQKTNENSKEKCVW